MNLFIDTHLNDVVIILFQNDKIIKSKIIKDEKQNSIFIMPTIKEVLDGIKPQSIIVVNGPGSFTGVRLGVTVAKTLAYTMNIPIRTITSLECLAISSNMNSKKIVSFSDNNGYYIGIFDEKNNVLEDYKYLKNSEYLNFKNNNNILENIILNYGEIFKFSLKKEPINAHKVNPIYIKKIEVEK